MKLRTILICFYFAVLALFTVTAVAHARTFDDTESDVDKQTFQLRLVGTAIAGNPEFSVAVVEFGLDGKHRSYHEGEQIGGVMIIEILRNRVVVETEQGEAFISSSRPLILSRSLTIESERPGTDQSPESVISGTGLSKNLRQQTLYLNGKTLTADLADLDDTIQKVSVDGISIYGQPAGVKIYPIEPESIFSKIGLKTGDVIKEVNGIEIAHPEEAIAVFKKLKEGENVDIKVKGRRTRRIHLIIK